MNEREKTGETENEGTHEKEETDETKPEGAETETYLDERHSRFEAGAEQVEHLSH